MDIKPRVRRGTEKTMNQTEIGWRGTSKAEHQQMDSKSENQGREESTRGVGRDRNVAKPQTMTIKRFISAPVYII